jgi:hypothetical protein
MALLEKLKIPFIIKEGDITVMNDPDIVWDWSDVDEVAFSQNRTILEMKLLHN